ncbi:hypothetical protein [Rhizobium sp. BK251]|uniref:hypothetical protein n=1 Tax=Rhizobium sp. BK251 TaxID=2512125 RepID=UPI001050E958|nr:hypothetical protein [Rhizobium sp. BK251]
MNSRGSIAQRVIERARDRGVPIDGDPDAMALVSLWITGEIHADEMRKRYVALLNERKVRVRHPLGDEGAE